MPQGNLLRQRNRVQLLPFEIHRLLAVATMELLNGIRFSRLLVQQFCSQRNVLPVAYFDMFLRALL